MFNAFGKDGWIDDRIGQGQWKRLKQAAADSRSSGVAGSPEAPCLLTNSLPELTLSDGATRVSQSHAIARWAARQRNVCGRAGYFDLYPTDAALDAALLVDEAMALVDSTVALAPKDADKEERLRRRAEYKSATGGLGVAMALFERRLSSSASQSAGGGPFLLGKELSIADLYLKKPLTDMILEGQFEGVEAEWLGANFPKVRAHSDMVAQHPLIGEYLEHYKN